MSYFDYLMKNGVPDTIPADGVAFEDMFDEYVASRQKTWKYDRNLSVGASEAFGCIRKNWFAKRGAEFGHEKDEGFVQGWGALERGNLIETFVEGAIKSGLERRGMSLHMSGESQDTLLDGKSSATPDGLVLDAPRDLLSYYGIPDIKSDCVAFEIKSFDPRINITHEKEVHAGQVQMQMGLIRETTEYKPEYAVICYVNASWLDDVRVYVVAYDEEVYQIGKARNEKVFEVDDPKLLGAEGKINGTCDYCPFQAACQKVTMARVPPKREPLKAAEKVKQDQEVLDKLDEMVVELSQKKRALKRLELEVEEANESIRQELIATNQSRYASDAWSVSYTTVAGRRTISKALLEQAGLDPEDFMAEGNGYEKLTVTLKGEVNT